QRQLGVAAEVDRVGAGLEEHAVARVEPDEVELGPGGGPQQAVEVLEHLRHEEPRRPGVETKAVGRPGPGTAAEVVARLEELDGVAVARQQRRGGQAGDAPADDRDPHARTLVPSALPARMTTLRVSGTRTRVLTSRCAGVARTTRASSVNSACAAATARRLDRGRCGIASAAIRRSVSTSSSRRALSVSVSRAGSMPGK